VPQEEQELVFRCQWRRVGVRVEEEA